MRHKIRKELLARFRLEFERRLPDFHSHKEKLDDPTWAWQEAPKLTFFVQLQLCDNKDQFVLEIAWSEDGLFPWWPMPSTRLQIDAPQWHVQLARLWATAAMADAWEIVPAETASAERKARLAALDRGEVQEFMRETPEEEYLPRVAPLVEDAVQKLIDFGLPLFRRVAEQRGIPWPDHEVS